MTFFPVVRFSRTLQNEIGSIFNILQQNPTNATTLHNVASKIALPILTTLTCTKKKWSGMFINFWSHHFPGLFCVNKTTCPGIFFLRAWLLPVTTLSLAAHVFASLASVYPRIYLQTKSHLLGHGINKLDFFCLVHFSENEVFLFNKTPLSHTAHRKVSEKLWQYWQIFWLHSAFMNHTWVNMPRFWKISVLRKNQRIQKRS